MFFGPGGNAVFTMALGYQNPGSCTLTFGNQTAAWNHYIGSEWYNGAPSYPFGWNICVWCDGANYHLSATWGGPTSNQTPYRTITLTVSAADWLTAQHQFGLGGDTSVYFGYCTYQSVKGNGYNPPSGCTSCGDSPLTAQSLEMPTLHVQALPPASKPCGGCGGGRSEQEKEAIKRALSR